jgi:hypothetical protein
MDYILAITLLLTPAYVVKFNLLHFPTNLLMIWVILVWAIFFGWISFAGLWREYIQSKLSLNKPVAILISLFLLAGLISLFVHGFDRAKLGQFIVLFLQPISIFFIGHFLIQKFPRSRDLLLVTCYLLLVRRRRRLLR